MPTKIKPLKIYASPQIRQLIEIQAKQQQTSISHFINSLIETYFKYTSIRKAILMTYKDLSDLAQHLEPEHRQKLSSIAANLLKCLT